MIESPSVRKFVVRVALGCATLLTLVTINAWHFVNFAESNPDGRFARAANALLSSKAGESNRADGTTFMARVESLSERIKHAVDSQKENATQVDFYNAFERHITAQSRETTFATYKELFRDGVIAQTRSMAHDKCVAILASDETPMRSREYNEIFFRLIILLYMDFRACALRGDNVGAIEATQAILAIDGARLRTVVSADRLSAMSSTRTFFRTIANALADNHVSPELCERLIAELAPWSPALSQADLFELDRLQALDCIDNLYEAGNRGRFIASNTLRIQTSQESKNPEIRSKLTGLWWPRRVSVETGVQDLHAFGLALATTPLATPARESISVPTERKDLTSFWNPSDVLVVVESYDSLVVQHAALVTMHAIELHRSRTGDLPATLDELVPGELASLPANISSPDRTFVYLLEGDDYTLYTTGPSGVDNQAQESPEGTQAPYRHGAITQTQASQDWDYVFHRAAKKQTKSAAP